MELDTQKVRELLDKRDQIDQELQGLFGREKKSVKCSRCNEEGHNSRACPQAAS